MSVLPFKKPVQLSREASVLCYGCGTKIPLSKQILVYLSGGRKPFCCEGCANERIISDLFR